MTPAWVVVPVKGFARGKSRLDAALDASRREALARQLFTHMMDVLDEGGAPLAGVLVVTDCDEVARLVRARGRDALMSTAALGAAVAEGLAAVAARSDGPAVVLMADLPHLARGDVDALIDALADADAAVAPDGQDYGTNGLALAKVSTMPTAFGTGDSFPRHLAAAERARVSVAVVRRPGLSFDVDTPADLARLPSARGAREPALASRERER